MEEMHLADAYVAQEKLVEGSYLIAVFHLQGLPDRSSKGWEMVLLHRIEKSQKDKDSFVLILHICRIQEEKKRNTEFKGIQDKCTV